VPIWVESTHNYLLVLEAVRYHSDRLCTIHLCNQNGENNNANQSCNLKFQKISHPDLHFPTVTTEEVKKNPKVLISLLTGDNS
jgi:hypothetical protein